MRATPAVRFRLMAAAVVIGLVVAGCALPATEEGFNQGFCEVDLAFETAAAAIVEIEDREEWIDATRDAMLDFRDALTRLPVWEPARDAKGELANALNAIVRLIESGVAGELVESAQWENALETMLTARENLRGVAGPCISQ
ncbi:MAG TPA: hypothetical protein VGO32_06870 [Candidatus Limnocylindria bacterium]|jgi:hypothetical protein|nr:hypothetical protein [Candidatus Limnocylindria bacterium]